MAKDERINLVSFTGSTPVSVTYCNQGSVMVWSLNAWIFKKSFFVFLKACNVIIFTPWLFFFNRLVKKYHWWSKSDLVSATKFLKKCQKNFILSSFAMTKNSDMWLIIQWYAYILQANFCWNLEGTMPLLVSNGFSRNPVKLYLLKKQIWIGTGQKFIFIFI